MTTINEFIAFIIFELCYLGLLRYNLHRFLNNFCGVEGVMVMEREEIDYALKVLTNYPGETKPNLIDDLKKNIAPLVNEIISIFEREKLTFEECYIILDFTYRSLKYKSQKVNL